MAYDWTMFFDDFAEDFHPTFRKELSKQLFAKGSDTGIDKFDSHNVQLIVGMTDPQLKQVENKVYALVEFITPTSFSFPVHICWTTSYTETSLEIHKHDVSNAKLEINWAPGFPLEQILPHLVNTERFD